MNLLPLTLILASICHADPAIIKSEFVFEERPTRECHASTLAETPSGLAAAWFAGTREKDRDVGIWFSRIGEQGWSKPVELFNGVQPDGTRHPCWNPVLHQEPNGPLVLYYKVGPSPSEWWGMRSLSTDGGKTWSKPQRLPGDALGPIKNKPVRLADGTLLCGSSTESRANGWRIVMERTSDLGATMDRTGPLNEASLGAIQPTILAWGPDRIQILCRARTAGKIVESWSKDGGKTWSAMVPIDLPNPNSGIDAVLLRDGRAVLIYNHTPIGRSPINLGVSNDGKTWQAGLVLEEKLGDEFSYPAVIQTADGLVHISYTHRRERIRHVVVDPAKLTPRPFQSGSWPK